MPNFLLSVLFPKFCLNCNKLSNYLCPNCQKKLKPIKIQHCPICQYQSINGQTHLHCQNPYSLNGAFSIFYYQPPLKKVIKKLKYQYFSDLAPFLVKLSLPFIPPFFKKFDFLIPIPLFPNRFKNRGFNQALLLSKNFSLYLKVPTSQNILKKTKPTLPQADLKKASLRRKNILNSFRSQNAKKIKNRSLLLIDDVTTSYSTLNEAARTLKEKGAKKVWALTIAHGG